MSPRILLPIFTILAAGAVIYFALEADKSVKELQSVLAKTKADLARTKSELADTKDKLAQTEAKLKETETELETTKTTLTQTKAERDDAKRLLTDKETELAAIRDQLKSVETSLTEVLGPDWKANVSSLKDTIQKLADQAKELQTKLDAKEKELAEQKTLADTMKVQRDESEKRATSLEEKERKRAAGIMELTREGRVVAVNSGWGFVVLNVGDRQGAITNKRMVVMRGGEAVGRVRISSVEPNQSIADIVPGSTRSKGIQPGDTVVMETN
jgi:septal ring factor EnvC (AmiA/AmiB activator)